MAPDRVRARAVGASRGLCHSQPGAEHRHGQFPVRGYVRETPASRQAVPRTPWLSVSERSCCDPGVGVDFCPGGINVTARGVLDQPNHCCLCNARGVGVRDVRQVRTVEPTITVNAERPARVVVRGNDGNRLVWTTTWSVCVLTHSPQGR